MEGKLVYFERKSILLQLIGPPHACHNYLKLENTRNSADGTTGFLGDNNDGSNLSCNDETCTVPWAITLLMILSVPMIVLRPVGH